MSNAATYLCNYSHHLLQAGSLSPLVLVFRPLLASVVAVKEHGADAHTMLVCLLCSNCSLCTAFEYFKQS